MTAVVAVAVAAALATAARADGVLDERIACAAQPEVTYALYRPQAWSTDQLWPVVVVLDPRGQAVPALKRFEQAAERYGFVIASAYDSRSDTLDADPTPGAVAAIVTDLPARANVAPGAVVLAGFSGTARSAWVISQAAPAYVLGVVAVGASTPRGEPVTRPLEVPWIGLAGNRDFNQEEVRTAMEAMARAHAPARFEPFVGSHQWPPAEVLTRALGWIGVAAAEQGRVAASASERAAFVDERRARAASLGPTWEAWFELRGVTGLEDEARAIGALPEVRRRERLENQLADEEFDLQVQIDAVVGWLEDPHRPPPGVERARSLLDVDGIVSDAARYAGTPRGDSAERRLSRILIWVASYVPRDMRARGDAARVRASLEIAVSVRPDAPNLQYDLACARAGVGDVDGAFAALAAARTAGFADLGWARTDPDLAPLRADPRFEATLGGP